MKDELLEQIAEMVYGGLDNLSPFDKEQMLKKARPIVKLCKDHYSEVAVEAVMKLPARGDMRRMAIQSIDKAFTWNT